MKGVDTSVGLDFCKVGMEVEAGIILEMDWAGAADAVNDHVVERVVEAFDVMVLAPKMGRVESIVVDPNEKENGVVD